jgi:hypothetical protein
MYLRVRLDDKHVLCVSKRLQERRLPSKTRLQLDAE